ncbi:hypothetical protein O6H91_06G060900 [Diphasiastrum complanatum]|uniref:Uncharacterized protein n=1 Tax=Diphasiastrum complanatum TaxID=34168 RepID=A0ACC2DE64_DIPCM|nr:hypothetical protein O6H91_06G060900 [Diphasiastrum complanatum]
MTSNGGGAEEESGSSSSRPKLSLQPRGASADSAPPADAAAATATAKSTKPSPFGAARPREQVIAEREGKNETEVLKEQAQKEWKPNIVLTDAQHEEKKAAEAELAFAQSEFEKESDPAKLDGLREEINLKEKRLEELLACFEKMAVQTAQSGGTRRSHEKVSGVSATTLSENSNGSGNFISRGRGRGGERSSYGNTWGATKGRLGQSQCYTCGEVGHYSRDCPMSGGSISGSRAGYSGAVGGRGGGNQTCYSCGYQGHFSRDCPYVASQYPGQAGYGASQYPGQAGYVASQYPGQAGYGVYYADFQGHPYNAYNGGVYGGSQAGGHTGGHGNYNSYPSGGANYSGRGDY